MSGGDAGGGGGGDAGAGVCFGGGVIAYHYSL